MDISNDFPEENIKFDDAGNENEEDLEVGIESVARTVIWGTDWTAETIFYQIKKQNIDLTPSFQRRDAWTDEKKSRFIESMMLGYPVPSVILAENKNKRNSYIVVDGKQRLLSIMRFFSDGQNKVDGFKELKLTNLKTLKELNGLTYSQIKENYSECIDNIENYVVRTVVIKNWNTEDLLYEIFLRINTGSEKLFPQELRQALKPGEFLTYLDEATGNSEPIRKMLNIEAPDKRMRDVEMALRFFAFKNFLSDYNGKLKDFLDLTCEKLNNEWNEKNECIKADFLQLEKAISFSQEIFAGHQAFTRHISGKRNKQFNRPIFELFTFYFSIDSIRNVLQHKDTFKNEFIYLNKDAAFNAAVSTSTMSSENIEIRFSKFFELLINLGDIKDKGLSIPKISLIDGKLKITEIKS